MESKRLILIALAVLLSACAGAVLAEATDTDAEAFDQKCQSVPVPQSAVAGPVSDMVTYGWGSSSPTYTITFNSNGGSAVSSIDVKEGNRIHYPRDPVKDGYTFDGWFDYLGEEYVYMPGHDLTLYAEWKEYPTITFNTDGGNYIAPIKQKPGTSLTAPANPEKYGYDFDGWKPKLPSKMPTESMTVVAQWKIHYATITFDTRGGSEIDPIKQQIGSTLHPPSDPVKEGHEFLGWTPSLPDVMPDVDSKYTAMWQTLSYNVIFEDTMNVNSYPYTVLYGNTIPQPNLPTVDHFEFMGWNPEVPSKMPAQNMTFTSIWKEHPTIIFDTQGGSEIDPIQQKWDTPVTKPDDPIKQGYDFKGWSPAFPQMMPTEDTVLKAQWERSHFGDMGDGDLPSGVTTILALGLLFAAFAFFYQWIHKH